MAGLDDGQLQAMLGGSARRIAAGEDALRADAAARPQDIAHPLTFARIHQYLSMATPLLWMRQPDTIGVLGLALNACDERSNGHREETEQIRELLLAARDLWRVFPEAEDETRTRRRRPAPAFRLLHLAEHHGGDIRMSEPRVNGHDHAFDAPAGCTLAETLRDDLGLTGTKIACGEGHCGACTVQLDGVPVLSCITLVHTVGDREVTTIEGPPATIRSSTRSSAPTPSSAASARRARSSRRRARRRDPEPRRPTRSSTDGREPLPLRHLSQDRGGDRHVARLIRSEKEVEGRYEEVWTLVEEDALVQWPAGPGAVVGRDAPRVDGYEKARGEARYTGDVKLSGLIDLRPPRVARTRA